MIHNWEILLRILLAAIFGGLIGMEREANNRPAGLRTHVLVTVGAALIMLVSIDAFFDEITGLRVGDPARLAAQVVSGVGFLGAGTIMRNGGKISGLTTAASLWVSAGIGLAIGSGYYLGGIFTAVVVLVTLMSLRSFERRLFKTTYRTLEIAARDRTGLIGEIGLLLGSFDIGIRGISILDIDESDFHNNILTASFKIKLSSIVNLEDLFKGIYNIEGMIEANFDE